MSNRIIRESICTSETIDGLSFGAECTFYRLLVNVDDYGRIDARTKLLKSRLYPVRDMSEDEFCKYMNELRCSGLIWEYKVDGKAYIQVSTWDKYQQVRTKRSKCPAPDIEQNHDDSDYVKCCNHLISDDIRSTQNVALNPNPYPNPNPKPEEGVYAREETETPGSKPTAIQPTIQPAADHLGDEISDEDMTREREVQDTAEQLVRAYGLPYNSRTLDAVVSDIKTKGQEAVKKALDDATDADTKGGVSLRFYRACLNKDHGGHGRKGRDSPGDMIRHSREEWKRSSCAAIIDLDDD